jgi:hypothetical protein
MQASTRRFLTPLPPANRLTVFNPHLMSEYAVPISLLCAAAFVDLLACKVRNPAVSTLAQGDESVSSSEPRGRQSAEFESHEASGLPQKHKLLTLYNGEPRIPQVHYYHDDIDVSARFCYSLGGSLRVL